MRHAATLFLLLAAGIGAARVWADPAGEKGSDAKQTVRDGQTRIEERYREFESVLGRMADLLRSSDPDRAALLAKAFGESKKELVAVQLRELMDRLEKGDLATALKDQEEVIADMRQILEMLLSEDRAERLRKKRERTEKYLKEVQGLLDRQKSIRSRTERASPKDAEQSGRLSKSEGKLAEDTKNLEKRIAKEDAEESSEQGEGEAGKESSESKEGKDASKGKEGSKSGGQPSGESKPSPSPGSPSNSPSSPQTPNGDQPPNSEATPGRQNLKEAERAMEEAKKRLEELKQQEASQEQDKAIRELEKTIKELEEILRQLREEERQELLANLESRLRQLLDVQVAVLEGTLQLASIAPDKRSRGDLQKALQLSRREATIVTGLEQVLVLLTEDGTAVAFPETIDQLRSDAESVVKLLSRAEAGSYTQRIEQDIIDTLEEMIEAIQKEMQSNKEQKQSPQQGGAAGRQPLVEKIAELKMIRSLQRRVNERTDKINELAKTPSGPPTDLNEAIQELADRQHRVYEITRDIAQGKND